MKTTGKTQIYLPIAVNLFIYALQHLLYSGYVNGDISIVNEGWGPTITGSLLMAFAVYVVANIVAGIICGLKTTSMFAILYWLIGFLVMIICNFIYCPVTHLSFQRENILVAFIQGAFQFAPFILVTSLFSEKNRKKLLKEKGNIKQVSEHSKMIIDFFNSRDTEGLKAMFDENIISLCDISSQIEKAFQIVDGNIISYDVVLRCHNDESNEYIIKNIATDQKEEYEFYIMTDIEVKTLFNIWLHYTKDGLQQNMLVGANL